MNRAYEMPPERGAEIYEGYMDDALVGEGSPLPVQAIVQPIGVTQISEALQTLMKYKAGKANLDNQIIESEEWYRMRHWEQMRRGGVSDGKGGRVRDEIEPRSAWLFNAIANKHADAMDNYPRPNVLPREASDVAEARILSSIIPPILEQCGFEEVYSDEQYYKLKHGTGVYGVFWDASASNGLGEIAIRRIDLLNLFWEPGITDIQDSRNLFFVELEDNEVLEEMYPQLKGKLSGEALTVGEYVHDDSIDTSSKTAVVDWYYKKNVSGKTVLHFCKFAGLEVLYATENDPAYASVGLYDHGKYPFVFDVLFPLEGTPAGFGYIAVGKSNQEYIDRGSQAFLENMLDGATPRYFAKKSVGVNMEEFADRKKKIVSVEGELGGIQPINTTPLAGNYIEIMNMQINELKEVTGNRDVTTGGTSHGVTAASAIAALQETGGKTSRDSNMGSYRAFRRVVELTIELIRQFYSLPHYFRIVGEGGAVSFTRYTNEHLIAQASGVDSMGEPVYRIPLFDIEISAEKQSPYSRLAQNEMALQFYSAGFFAPQNADAALVCLDMMDFDRKDMVMQKVMQNQTLLRQLTAISQTALALAQVVDQQNGTQYTAQLQASFAQQGLGGGMPQGMGGISPEELARSTTHRNTVGEGSPLPQHASEESHVTRKARERAASVTEV